LEDLFDYVVHSKELPAHAEQEEFSVPVRNQYLINGSCKLYILKVNRSILEG
jgi:hypothetical protein